MVRRLQKQISLAPADHEYLQQRREATGIPISAYLRVLIAADRRGHIPETMNLSLENVALPCQTEPSKS